MTEGIETKNDNLTNEQIVHEVSCFLAPFAVQIFQGIAEFIQFQTQQPNKNYQFSINLKTNCEKKTIQVKTQTTEAVPDLIIL